MLLALDCLHVKVLYFLSPLTAFGDSVTIDSTCFDDGTLVYSWTADEVYRLQIERQCFTNSDEEVSQTITQPNTPVGYFGILV